MTELLEHYRRRPISFLELWEEADWRIKVYSITEVGASIRPELLAAAKDAARRWLRQPLAPGRRHYGVGFMGVHEGPSANFVFLDWWADDNELYHQVYLSAADNPDHLQYVTPTGLAATVWDLRVLCFERQAWVDTVLANPPGPDLDAYLKRRLNEVV
jgi:hypothetical protein